MLKAHAWKFLLPFALAASCLSSPALAESEASGAVAADNGDQRESRRRKPFQFDVQLDLNSPDRTIERLIPVPRGKLLTVTFTSMNAAMPAGQKPRVFVTGLNSAAGDTSGVVNMVAESQGSSGAVDFYHGNQQTTIFADQSILLFVSRLGGTTSDAVVRITVSGYLTDLH